MQSHTLDELRSSLMNTSKKERSTMTPPTAFDELDWEHLTFLGWVDPKMPKRAYVVAEALTEAGELRLTGAMLQQAEASPRTRAQCSWCRDVELPCDVVMYSARRAGAAGRKGNTIGSLVCQHFECSHNVRKLPPLAYPGFDREAARQRRMMALEDNVLAFLGSVAEG